MAGRRSGVSTFGSFITDHNLAIDSYPPQGQVTYISLRRLAGTAPHQRARSRPRNDRVRFGMRSSALANCAAASSVRPRASRNSPYIS